MATSNKNSKFDVAKYYDEVIATNLNKNTKAYLDQLFSIKYDQKTVERLNVLINDHQKQIDHLNKNGWMRNWSKLLIGTSFFIGLGLAIIGFLLVFLGEEKQYVYLPILGILLVIISSIFFFIRRSRVKAINQEITPIQQELDEAKNKAYDILKPIYRNFSRRNTFNLMERSFTDVKLKNVLDNDDLITYHTHILTNSKTSLHSLVHGHVFSNPFMFRTMKKHYMGEKTYTGSTSRTIDGKTYTFTASITKPYPEFTYETKMLLASNNFNNLEFHFEPSLKWNWQVNHFYKKHKNQRKMENSEFDLLFPAIRNDEIQFRSLFTIFTQEEFIRNAKHFKTLNKHFNFAKIDQHLYEVQIDSAVNEKQLNWSSENFKNFNPQAMYEDYASSLNKVFYGLYQYWSPIFSCSALQQERYLPLKANKKYLEVDDLNNELIINQNTKYESLFHPSRDREVNDGLLKISDTKNFKGYQTFKINILNFEGIERVTYITAYSGGYSDSVPVHWTEYLPLRNNYVAISYPTNDNFQYSNYLLNDLTWKQEKICGIIKDEQKTIVIFKPNVNLATIDIKKIKTIVSRFN